MTSLSSYTVPNRCQQCGSPLNAQAPEGFCPSCMLEGALRLGSPPDCGIVPMNEGTEEIGTRFADYDLLEEIGRGGMGVVYRARQRSLNRIVAVKMILAGQFASKHEVLRFRAEAEMAARLHHPNIVAVHETGEHQGQQYFSMDFIQGRSLAEIVRDSGPLSAKRAATYLRSIALAIDYAHKQGVLHRDLKPSNVLIDTEDRPRITDFGLAKRLRGDFGVTVTGQILGSPNFMPPEQAVSSGQPEEAHVEKAEVEQGLVPARMSKVKIGPASDVYGIGAILYHLLTARPPFQAATIHDVLLQLRETDPVAPRLLSLSVPRDLETICLKCLEKDPGRRYQTAQQTAEELDRFLNDEPIRARPVIRAERLWRWCRRKPALAISILLLVLGIGGPVATFRINQARLLSEQKGRLAEQNLYASNMRLASEAVHKGAFNHARELLEKHVPKRGEEDLRNFEWRYLAHAVQANEPVRTLEGLPALSGWSSTRLFRSERFLYNQSESTDQIKAWDMTTWEPVPIVPPAQPTSVHWQWDPARGSAYALDQAQHTVTVYRLPNLEPGPTFRVPGPISTVKMSYDRQTLAVGFQEGATHRVQVWDLARNTRRRAPLGNLERAIFVMTFSGDGKMLAVSSTNGVFGIWDLETSEPLVPPPVGASAVRGMEFTVDNTLLLYGKYPAWNVWDLEAGRRLELEHVSSRSFDVGGVSPDGRHLIVVLDAGDLAVLDSRNLVVKGLLRGHRSGINGIAFSPDGKLMTSASEDQTARIWDLTTQAEVGIVGGFGERIAGVEFSDNGQNIVLIGGFGQIRVYNLSVVLRRGLFAKIAEQEGISRLSLSPDERLIATISVAGTLALWDRQSRSLLRSNRFPRYTDKSYPTLSFAPNGKRVAWVTGDALRIMLIKSGEIRETGIDGNSEINSVAFSPNGDELAFGCRKELRIYELTSGRVKPLVNTDDEVFSVEYSPDGACVVFGDRRGTVTLYERASGKVLSKIMAHAPQVNQVKMSPDGKLLATCGADSTIKLWRVQPSGRLQDHPTTLRGHVGYVNHLAFSPDGARLASTSGDHTLKIWDTDRAVELATLYGHSGMSGSVQFTEDGHTIYSSGYDGEIHFWEAPPLAKLDISGRSSPTESRQNQFDGFK